MAAVVAAIAAVIPPVAIVSRGDTSKVAPIAMATKTATAAEMSGEAVAIATMRAEQRRSV
jgi:hypothetical protein